jgi:RNA polymerase subunit RPABC4/transcription elongation factor Spt4
VPWNDDNDAADEEWVDEGEDPADDDLLSCPSCRRSVHEDTQQCPHCGDWITPVDLSGRSKRWIWAVAVIVVILSMSLVAIF